MDLISKEAVVNTIYKRDDRLKKNEIYRSKGGSIDLLGVLPEIRAIPSAFEGKTNGEVIKALFPNALRSDYIENDMLILYLQDDIESEMVVPEEWWNAPYKAESEDKE